MLSTFRLPRIRSFEGQGNKTDGVVHVSRLTLLLAAAFMQLAILASSAMADDSEGYKLLPGDQLQISVWREEILDRDLTILPDGNITFPLAGRIHVQGLTTPQVEGLLTDKLKEYLAEPVVTVSVTSVSGNRVYVVGKATDTGPFVMTTPTTIAQMLSVVGAFDRFAELDEIKILRGQGANAEYISFNYDDLVSGANAEKATMLLQAGDVIIIP